MVLEPVVVSSIFSNWLLEAVLVWLPAGVDSPALLSALFVVPPPQEAKHIVKAREERRVKALIFFIKSEFALSQISFHFRARYSVPLALRGDAKEITPGKRALGARCLFVYPDRLYVLLTFLI